MHDTDKTQEGMARGQKSVVPRACMHTQRQILDEISWPAHSASPFSAHRGAHQPAMGSKCTRLSCIGLLLFGFGLFATHTLGHGRPVLLDSGVEQITPVFSDPLCFLLLRHANTFLLNLLQATSWTHQ